MRIIMSHILYSSIARAGGIDLFLGTESLSHPPYYRPVKRRRKERGRRLRRRIGQGLVYLGQLSTRWGSALAEQASCKGALPAPRLVS